MKMVHYMLSVVTCIILINSACASGTTSHKNGRLSSQQIIYPSREIYYDYCQQGRDDGKHFCRLDLLGYYICGTNEFVKCPQHTRCNCNLKAFCWRENPCTAYKVPYPMKPSASFRFQGKNTNNYHWNPKWASKYGLSGVVKQDAENGKFLQIITSRETYNTEGNEFQLIVPGEAGTFIQYKGQAGLLLSCKKEILTHFKPFGDNLGNFQHSDSNLTHESYYYAYELGNMWGWHAGRLEWNFETRVDHERKIMEPIRSHYFQSGDDGESWFRFNQNVEWTTSSLGSPLPNTEKWYANLFQDLKKDWFQVSDCCKGGSCGWNG